MNNISALRRSVSVCAGLAATTFVLSLGAAPAGPVPQVPEGGGNPGPFPNTSVSSVNVIARGSTEFNGNVEVQGFEGHGPIPWSVNRYNRGDFALRLSPGNPVDALTNLNAGFIEFGDASPGLAASHAWRPQPQFGVTIPTARQNGPIDWGDGEGGFYPTIALSESASGPGYSMENGSFGGGDLDINTGRAGSHATSPEANFSFSATWFPYDAGWIGGEAAGPDAFTGQSSWTRPTAHSVGLTPGMVKWLDHPTGSGIYGGLAELSLPGVNSRTNGMLFATSSDGSSDINIVGVAAKEDGTGWLISIREDSEVGAETLVDAGQSEFQFVYVPYAATNLIGGWINGEDAALIDSAGSYTLTRTALGTYELTVPGKNASSGTLLLQVADFEPGTSVPLASRAFLSYQFSDGKFIIQSRKTTSDTTADLVDADFYWAWVDFQNPLAMPDWPRLRSLPVVRVTPQDIIFKEANIAVNTDIPQVLVTTIDEVNFGAYFDPVTGEYPLSALVGYFYDPITLTQTGDPFVILGNPTGTFTRHDVKYNPVSKQYVVVANARTYGANALSIPLLALVNTNTPPGSNSPLARTWVYDPNTQNNYDDVAVAVSSQNGNILFAAEYSFPGEGEGTVGVLFEPDGTLLTPQFGRLDLLQGAGDEDDPDVTYLESIDAFLYLSNTDIAGGLVNRVVGSIIRTTPDANNNLATQTEQLIGDGLPEGAAEGHPAAMMNPFNGQLITAFDVGGNNVANGQVAFHNIGAAPAYTFTSARTELDYLTGAAGVPFNHNHPQLAADTDRGVIAIGHNARQSAAGYPEAYAFSLYDREGSPLQTPFNAPYFLADAPGGIDSGPSLHNLKYSPFSDAFLAVFRTIPGAVYLTGFQVTSGQSQPGEQPTLGAARDGNNLIFTWPVSASGFGLESTPGLGAPNWTAVPGAPTQEGDHYRLSVPIQGNAGYFRLRN